jgi:hypothetical protein
VGGGRERRGATQVSIVPRIVATFVGHLYHLYHLYHLTWSLRLPISSSKSSNSSDSSNSYLRTIPKAMPPDPPSAFCPPRETIIWLQIIVCSQVSWHIGCVEAICLLFISHAILVSHPPHHQPQPQPIQVTLHANASNWIF